MTMMATQEQTDPSVLLHHEQHNTEGIPSTEITEEDEVPMMMKSAVADVPSMTPPRSSLATDPNLTPIASIKRPRNQIVNGVRHSMTPKGPATPSITSAAATPLSPMHGVKVVHQRSTDEISSSAVKDKVDVLFSPVLQFLHDYAAEHSDDEDDASMTRPEQPDGADGDFNPWQFIASLPAYESVVHSRPEITLPPLLDNDTASALKKTLVLDLDETLVHCSVQPVDQADFTFPVQFHGETYSVHVKCRPHLQEFLQAVSQHFEVIVFTASQKVYADALLNILDPDAKCIHHRLFRESCLAVEGNYLKDLHVLGRDLSRTVLVDNSPHAFGYQVDNGIPIESWFDDSEDRELVKLQRFLLKSVLPAPDVRVPVRQKFQSHQLVETAPPLYG